MDSSIFESGQNHLTIQCLIHRKTKSVDPDETVHYEASHLNLHCLQNISFDLQD